MLISLSLSLLSLNIIYYLSLCLSPSPNFFSSPPHAQCGTALHHCAELQHSIPLSIVHALIVAGARFDQVDVRFLWIFFVYFLLFFIIFYIFFIIVKTSLKLLFSHSFYSFPLRKTYAPFFISRY